jgi:hypothetical protein
LKTGEKEEVVVLTEDPEKCTKQFALSAVKNAKFLSSLQETDLSTAENALQRRKDFNSSKE